MKQESPKRFERVEIQFVNMDDAALEYATVLLRGEEMVIDIQAEDGLSDYLILGKPRRYFFEGLNSAGELMPKVQATWTILGQTYVGVWVEDGHEYLFSFELHE